MTARLRFGSAVSSYEPDAPAPFHAYLAVNTSKRTTCPSDRPALRELDPDEVVDKQSLVPLQQQPATFLRQGIAGGLSSTNSILLAGHELREYYGLSGSPFGQEVSEGGRRPGATPPEFSRERSNPEVRRNSVVEEGEVISFGSEFRRSVYPFRWKGNTLNAAQSGPLFDE
ncbi:MAG: hypothetical protein D6775_03465 [Caldilineae bacterium]|nr:MAG: hypothetical protein D6775_03465 [Caldilineae bacterium]